MAAPTDTFLAANARLRGLTAGYVRVKRAELQSFANLNVPYSCSLRWPLKVDSSAVHMVSLSGPLPGSPPTERLFICRRPAAASARFRHGWREAGDFVSTTGATIAA